MSADQSVTATFTLITHTLTVTKAGGGSGSVTSSPAGINCGATCSAGYNQGTPVTLTATPASGSTFTGWSGGGCSGAGTCTVTMSADQSVTATFASVPVVGPPSVGGGLFCGAQHRGRCVGLKIKTFFPGPGNAVWQFAAYNPAPGQTARATTAASKVVALGKISRKITHAGSVTIVFKLKRGARTNRLYRKVLKLKLRTIKVTLTFTTTSGVRLVSITNVRLKL
jgi:hypothetical protein